MFFLIILLIIFVILTLNNKLIEGMDRNISNQGSKPYSTVKRFYGGTFNSTFDGRSAIDDQYFPLLIVPSQLLSVMPRQMGVATL